MNKVARFLRRERNRLLGRSNRPVTGPCCQPSAAYGGKIYSMDGSRVLIEATELIALTRKRVTGLEVQREI